MLRNLVLLTVLLAAGAAYGHPKTDVVRLINGDRITCEIKELQLGKLSVGTAGMGTIHIEWDDVVSLESLYYYRVEDSHGRRLFGRLRMEKEDLLLEVLEGPAEGLVPHDDVVEIVPLETSFWSRMKGSISVGYSYTKAADVSQFTFDWTNHYRTEVNLWEQDAHTILTDTKDTDTRTRRVDLSFAYTRIMRRFLTVSASVSGQRNDELGLDRRLLISVGPGVTPVKTNNSLGRLAIGLAFNNEVGVDGTETTSVEGEIGGSYSIFKYDTPKTNLDTNLNYFPSITEEGRYRLDFDIKLRHEVISDLFIDLSYYTNYDSDAPSGGGEEIDYGVIISGGWSY